MPATMLVGIELARALGAVLALPFRAAWYLLRRSSIAAAVRRDLDHPAAIDEDPLVSPTGRRLTIFVSCAEPSAETHGVHLVRELRAELARLGAPAPRFLGLGSPRLAAEGVELVGNPLSHAVLGVSGVLRSVPFYLKLLKTALVAMRAESVDLFVPVDAPALHVPLARMARKSGIPVVHFVAPQYWGWAPWRVRGYRSAVDKALTILPFEPPWFERAEVTTAHIGHPHLDALPERRHSGEPGDGRTLALLAGSRPSVVRRHLPWMLDLLRQLREEVRDLRVVMPHARPELRELIERIVAECGASDWVELRIGELHEALTEVDGVFSISGTVLVDLLHHRLPAVVVFRVGRMESWMYPRMLAVPWFSSPNLLAAEEIYPEFCVGPDGESAGVLTALRRLVSDSGWRGRCRTRLERAANRLGPPGATRRAAVQALAHVLGSEKCRTWAESTPREAVVPELDGS